MCGASGHVSPVDPAVGAAYVTAMINKFTTRIVSFHVKDMVDIEPACNNDDQRELGQGQINFAPMFAAAQNRVKYYLAERDPVAPGGPTNFNPFVNTANSALAHEEQPGAVLKAYPPTFPSVAAGAVSATVPLVVPNEGDAPLTFTNVALAANADDGGNQTRDDFQIVNHNCVRSRPRPIPPGGTCTVNLAFRPSRTNYTSVARVQFNSNSDDAMDRVLLAATSTGEAVETIGGDVPSLLQLAIPSAGASFGIFVPALARNYETALAATVTTTTGDAALTVTDPGVAPGHLVNGSFSLPQPINARAVNVTNPTAPFVPLAETTGAPTQLLTLHARSRRSRSRSGSARGSARPTSCVPATTARRSRSRCRRRRPRRSPPAPAASRGRGPRSADNLDKQDRIDGDLGPTSVLRLRKRISRVGAPRRSVRSRPWPGRPWPPRRGKEEP